MALSLALDLLVSGLLAVTICYAMVLNKKIGTLRRDKSELEKMAASFNAATTKADKSLKRLKNTAEDLGDRIEKAHSLRDDLMFLTERGSTAADKLENLVRTARDDVQPFEQKPAPDKKRSGKFDTSDFAGADSDVAEFSKHQVPNQHAQNRKSTDDKRRQLAASRSDAERELIRALQLAR